MTAATCGTHAGYYRHRRRGEESCDPCARAYRLHHERWRSEHYAGVRRTVDGDPVRAHLDHLHDDLGMSFKSIAKAAGVSAATVNTVRRRTGSGVHRDTANRLLAVTGPVYVPRHADDETFVPKVGAVRRIQALLALGWTNEEMRARCGVRTAVLLSQSGDHITVRNHARIVRLYDDLSMTPGPSAITRRRAAAAGYLPPLAWDDDSLDLLTDNPPNEEEFFHSDEPDIDEVAVDRFIAGTLPWQALSVRERIHAAVLMQARGYSRRQIHDHCHINQQQLHAALNQALAAA